MKHADLSPIQLSLLGTNGCGSKGSIIKPPFAIFFKSSCDIHDVSYLQGGTEEDRVEADIGFFRYLLNDCNRISNRTKRYKYLIWCYLYFIAVRTFGHKYFSYRAQRIPLEELINNLQLEDLV